MCVKPANILVITPFVETNPRMVWYSYIILIIILSLLKRIQKYIRRGISWINNANRPTGLFSSQNEPVLALLIPLRNIVEVVHDNFDVAPNLGSKKWY